ncbi:hypothetical protein WK68_03220 [Burkholderia ubonensis]|nr:hypothetical protein WK68_03220 [Burkholderia ubonensis]
MLCYDYEGDFVRLGQLLGGPLPRGWKNGNVNPRLSAERLASYYADHGGEHHALHDARANASALI